MTQAAAKASHAQKESGAFKYLREKVAREMANVYAAFGETAPRADGKTRSGGLEATKSGGSETTKR